MRGTWPSTLAFASPLPRLQPPREGVQPRWSGLRAQGTASSPPSATGPVDGSNHAALDWAPSGRIAQRESARFTRGRSLVRSQLRPFVVFVTTEWRVPSRRLLTLGERLCLSPHVVRSSRCEADQLREA